MDKVLWFQNYVDDDCEYHDTIQGENFRTLMDLCFDRADKFSLLRTDWPGAKDSPLEQALRPYLLGEYLSYCILHSFDHEARLKCYIYWANEETRDIFLSHITHLFGRDEAPDAPRLEKYDACDEAAKAASDRFMKRVEAEEEVFGVISDEDFTAIEEEEFREAKALWRKVFDEADYNSGMEDPCFYRGDETFFWTLTHETQCCAWVVDEPFGEKLRELGRWTEEDKTRSLGQLSGEDGLVWYGAAKNT